MKVHIILLTIISLIACTPQKSPQSDYPLITSDTLKFYPEVYPEKPNLPSPFLTTGDREILLVKLSRGDFALLDVTVENSGIRDVIHGKKNKGSQLMIDEEDFPTLAKTGLNKDKDLDKLLSITGKSVAEITVDGWSGNASYAGFLCPDDNIISRLKTDNELVRKMKVSHQQLAYPIFHIWNLISAYEKVHYGKARYIKIDDVFYNGMTISFKAEGGRGWQTSIFNDSLTGTYQINLKREGSELFSLHFSDLAPYYIMRYGFYEGLTGFRMDPRRIALTFGLISPDKIENLNLLPTQQELETCPDVYLGTELMWQQTIKIRNTYKDDEVGRIRAFYEYYPTAKDPIRRLILQDLIRSEKYSRAELALNELKTYYWESDTTAANALIKIGKPILDELEELFYEAKDDSIVKWRILNTMGKISNDLDDRLLNQAVTDDAWIIKQEALFILKQQKDSDGLD